MRSRTAEDARLLELLDPVAEAAGYEIVRLRLMGGDQARRLQVMADTPEGEMNVEDCARLSRALSEVLDAADPITGEYTLEVSTPGVDRPLTRLKDFAAFEGHEARLELDRVAEGRKRFRGELAGVEGDQVAVNLEGEAETALDAGTQHGELFRLEGKGVPDLRTGNRGDMVVVVHVRVPRKLTARQREAIEALRDAERPAAPKGGETKDAGPRKRGGFWGKMKDSFGS